MYDKTNTGILNARGFTLVELLIGIAISSVVLSAAYSFFSSQQKIYVAQKGVVDIQQNLRAGMYYMTREIRLAGYNHDHEDFADADVGDINIGIVQAGPGMVRFAMDIYDGSGFIGDWDGLLNLPGEDVIYRLVGDGNPDGPNFPDGEPDAVTALGTRQPAVLGREDILGGMGIDPLVEDVEAIAFAYAFDEDNDGMVDFVDGDGDEKQDAGEPTLWAVDTDNDQWLDTLLDTDADGDIDVDDTVGGTAMALADLVAVDRIRVVRIWMLVRSPKKDDTFSNQGTYVVGDKHIVVDDNFRRRLLTASVVCRNMGG